MFDVVKIKKGPADLGNLYLNFMTEQCHVHAVQPYKHELHQNMLRRNRRLRSRQGENGMQCFLQPKIGSRIFHHATAMDCRDIYGFEGKAQTF